MQQTRMMGMGDGEDGACTHPACSRPSYSILCPTLGSPHLPWRLLMPSTLGIPQHSPPSFPTMTSMELGFGMLA